MSTFNSLVRVSLSGDLQEEVISLGYIRGLTQKVFQNDYYFLIGGQRLYRLSGNSLQLIFEFENDNVVFLFTTGVDNLLLFYDEDDDEIIAMNSFEKFFRPFKSDSDLTNVHSLHLSANGYYFSPQFVSSDNDVRMAIYNKAKYSADGFIKTEIVSEKGLIAPIQLTAAHNPLSANAWVKVYVKVDKASSWGVPVITSSVDGAVSSIYDFVAGSKYKFIQFKAEWGNDSNVETPENVQLEFVYLPLGLANSN